MVKKARINSTLSFLQKKNETLSDWNQNFLSVGLMAFHKNFCRKKKTASIKLRNNGLWNKKLEFKLKWKKMPLNFCVAEETCFVSVTPAQNWQVFKKSSSSNSLLIETVLGAVKHLMLKKYAIECKAVSKFLALLALFGLSRFRWEDQYHYFRFLNNLLQIGRSRLNLWREKSRGFVLINH